MMSVKDVTGAEYKIKATQFWHPEIEDGQHTNGPPNYFLCANDSWYYLGTSLWNFHEMISVFSVEEILGEYTLFESFSDMAKKMLEKENEQLQK